MEEFLLILKIEEVDELLHVSAKEEDKPWRQGRVEAFILLPRVEEDDKLLAAMTNSSTKSMRAISSTTQRRRMKTLTPP